MMDEYRLTQEEKLMLIEELLQELSQGRTDLQVIHSDDVLHGKPPAAAHATVHTYHLLGGEQPRRTHTANLMAKLEEANRQRAADPDQEEQDREVEMYRYFKSNVRCFRCKKVGHHKYACLEESGCFYCLSVGHASDRCPQRTVCYQCYQWGHIITDCPATGAAFCQECKRKHTRACCFLTKGIEPIKQMFNTDYLYSHEHTRCMHCFQYGHLYCQQGPPNATTNNNNSNN